MNIANFKAKLRIVDYYVLITYVLIIIADVILVSKIENPAFNFLKIILELIILFLLINFDDKDKPFLSTLRNLYYMGIVFFVYDQVQILIAIVNPIDYDDILINWDRAILGNDVSAIFHKIANPYLTEYLQIAYTSFYLWFIIMGIEFYRKQKKNFDIYSRNVIFGFFLSFFLYFFMPAIGPRLTLCDFTKLNAELPGLYLTNYLRNIVNQGGGIINNTLSPSLLANRDCMPSGHTMMSVINMFFAFKYRLKSKWFVGLFGISIIFATLYLRYHYFVDIIAGVFFAIISLCLEPSLKKIIHKYAQRRSIFEY